MTKRNVSLIVVGLFIGAAIGGVLGNILGWGLPDGVVKDFFLTSLSPLPAAASLKHYVTKYESWWVLPPIKLITTI